MLDNVNPDKVAAHKDAQTGETLAACGIGTIRGEHLQHNEDHNVGVQHMVQPATKGNRNGLNLSLSCIYIYVLCKLTLGRPDPGPWERQALCR